MARPSNFGALPGFGLPLSWTPSHSDLAQASEPEASKLGDDKGTPSPNARLFPTALNINDGDLDTFQMQLTTLREFTMLRFMNQLTDKPGWEHKVFDSSITTKWKEEALAQNQPVNDVKKEESATHVNEENPAPGDDENSERQSKDSITEKMVDWCFAELQFKAKIFQENGGLVSVYNGDVVKSDSAIPPDLQAALKAAVEPLEDVPDRLKDWHPGSDELVLDLVHPSLFPLVYGRSKVLKEGITTLDDCIERCGEGETLPIRSDDSTSGKVWVRPDILNINLYSNKFQWLPCEVDVSANDGSSVRITSYINNLHPQERSLYLVIEQVIARAIPLWNMTLSPLLLGVDKHRRIHYDRVEYNPDPASFPKEEGPQQEEGEDEDDHWGRRWEWIQQTQRVILPEPETFAPPPYMTTDSKDQVDLRRDFGERGLQVIVKLASIHLNPEKPAYNGGSWHVEGQMNEHICATALYYYDCENITTSQLSFRQQSTTDIGWAYSRTIDYPQNQDDWLEKVFGCENYGSSMQQVGAVETRAGRLITFPNILQHQVQPFSLKDRSKPGHRKLLALFLVDPTIKVISTAHVPCQRKDWWQEVVNTRSAIGDLPRELQDQVFQEVEEFPIDMEEAKQLRLDLMEERKKFVVDSGIAFENIYTFALCEH